MRIRRGVITVAIAVAALLAAAPAAGAFDLDNVVANPASDQAGANANLTLGFEVNDDAADLRDLTVHLPPGLIGNPLAAPMCTETDLQADACDPASDVGDVTNGVTAEVLGFLPLPLTVNGDVYNVVPHPGEPARFGIVLDPSPIPIPILGNPLLPKIIVQSSAALRPSDLGLDTILNGLPNSASVAGLATAIHIDSLQLTLNGTASKGGFIRLPTSCKTHTVGFDAVAYNSDTAHADATFATTNCDALPFKPVLSAKIKRVGRVNEPVRLSTTIAQTIEEAGLKRAQVILPAGLGGNNDVLNNQCSQAAFSAGNCPASSIVGSAEATSPLQSEGLKGPVALLTPSAPGLPELGIDLRGPLALKLKGTLGFTDQGRNIVVFDNLPDIPISDFTLTFAGGDGGLVLPARDVCSGPPLTFDAKFLAHSGATRDRSADAAVDCKDATSGGGGTGGGNGRKPKAKIKVGRLGSDSPTMKATIVAGESKLRSSKIVLPNSLRFTNGPSFDRNVKARRVKIRHGSGNVRLRAKKPARRIRARFSAGALAAGKRASAKPKFKVIVRDARGKRTKLTVRAR